ncbi:hypothetical protein DAPPUDRAFT_260884 [Daphnia pulex]|uniref:Uncharacterized protein n=1 Tax=Daphnia pulex TaxID=6669 RepID=E9HK12_DAPPU|nr:hypothetical protein DAPPUDRAFT_260884 [Daphnia pulex]|eukprot:EFX67909.1 hypothetical protein DAPPUDRAFT_260884 [Daphnia pulex]
MSHLLLQKLFRMLEDPPIQNKPSSPTRSIEEADATQGAKDPPISNKQIISRFKLPMFIRWLVLDGWHPSDVSSNSSNSTELQLSAQRFSLFPLLRETSITGGEMTTLLLLFNSVGLLGLFGKVNGKC